MIIPFQTHACVLVSCLSLLSQSCAVGPQSILTVDRPDRSLGNWDTIELTQLDGRKPRVNDQKVVISPGYHKLVFHRDYMRGDMNTPIEVEVPVQATFKADKTYLAYSHNQSYGLLGVLVAEEKPVPEGNVAMAGAFVYSSDYDLYQQQSEKKAEQGGRGNALKPHSHPSTAPTKARATP